MTTLTLKAFANKLGFNRVSDARFQTLLKQWSIEGMVKIYQGGYRGHSTAHPKKAQLLKSLDFFEEKSARKEFQIYDAKIMLEELGFKLMYAAKTHQCSNPKCKEKIKKSTMYATATVFLTSKLCSDCVQSFCEGEITIKPEIRIIEKEALND